MINRLKYFTTTFFLLAMLISCKNNGDGADAYGSFEAQEILVSAKSNGELLSSSIEEGVGLEKGQVVAVIDTTALYIQKGQLKAQKQSVLSKINQLNAQKEVYKTERENFLIEESRVKKLLKDGAATRKQMDDIQGRLKVLNSQLQLVDVQTASVNNEVQAINQQLKLIAYNIENCKVKNPIQGMVIEKYIENHELANIGKVLYKIAPLNEIFLRAYVSEPQLANFAIGDTVTVRCDKNDSLDKFKGVVTWVSAEAEFTPKIVQTTEERVNLVYAIKVKVKNNGQLKIGMPGEVLFQ